MSIEKASNKELINRAREVALKQMEYGVTDIILELCNRLERNEIEVGNGENYEIKQAKEGNDDRP